MLNKNLLITIFHTKFKSIQCKLKYIAKVNKESPSPLDKNFTNSHFWIKLWIKLWQNRKNNDATVIPLFSLLSFHQYWALSLADLTMSLILHLKPFDLHWSLWKTLYDWFRVGTYVWLNCRLIMRMKTHTQDLKNKYSHLQVFLLLVFCNWGHY